jgi:hypothetical protein
MLGSKYLMSNIFRVRIEGVEYGLSKNIFEKIGLFKTLRENFSSSDININFPDIFPPFTVEYPKEKIIEIIFDIIDREIFDAYSISNINLENCMMIINVCNFFEIVNYCTDKIFIHLSYRGCGIMGLLELPYWNSETNFLLDKMMYINTHIYNYNDIKNILGSSILPKDIKRKMIHYILLRNFTGHDKLKNLTVEVQYHDKKIITCSHKYANFDQAKDIILKYFTEISCPLQESTGINGPIYFSNLMESVIIYDRIFQLDDKKDFFIIGGIIENGLTNLHVRIDTHLASYITDRMIDNI